MSQIFTLISEHHQTISPTELLNATYLHTHMYLFLIISDQSQEREFFEFVDFFLGLQMFY